MNKFKDLFERYLRNECTETEIEFLFQSINDPENESCFKQAVEEFIKKQDNTESTTDSPDLDDRLTYLRDELKTEIRKSDDTFIEPRLIRWKPILYAASLLLILSSGLYFGLSIHHTELNEATRSVGAQVKIPQIKPGGNNAILTLGDQSQVVLNNTKDGLIKHKGKISINKNKNGVLEIYAPESKEISKELLGLQTPNGGQYQVILSDKTKVWLNSGSSIRFPASFGSGDRRVEITGEVYFEVAKARDESGNRIPFFVTASQTGNATKQEITVLGTHFNVNAYSDERAYTTTLLEGSVMVRRIDDRGLGKSKMLAPGQQARVDDTISVNNVDVTQSVAWKNGLISFVDADIKSIMRQVKRWYDVDVIYSGEVSERLFTGKVSRNANLNELLNILKRSNIKVSISGKTITVLPNN